MHYALSRTYIRQIYAEVAAKNIAVITLFTFLLLPEISYEFEVLRESQQGAVLSILGFLMAAGIIGAFELSYAKTDLTSPIQRYLAHACKFLIYMAVCTLLWIGQKTMEISGGYFNDWIQIAGIMMLCALFIYDIWDIVCAVERLSKESQ